MFNLQGTLLVMSSSPPLSTSSPPHSHPWLTTGGSNRAVTVPKCLSWSGFPWGEQLFLIVSFISSCGMGGDSSGAVDWPKAEGVMLVPCSRLSTIQTCSWHLAGYGEQQHAMLEGCIWLTGDGLKPEMVGGSLVKSASLHLTCPAHKVRIKAGS